MIKHLFIALFVALITSTNSLASTQDVYATVSSNKPLNLREGPSTNSSVIESLAGGSSVKVIDIETYNNGWVHILTPSGKTGYVSAYYLTGDYVESFNSPVPESSNFQNLIEKILYKCSNFINSVENYCEYIFRKILNYGYISLVILTLCIALSSLLIYCVRRLDSSFEIPWIHYVLYIIALLPMWGVFSISLMHEGSLSALSNILLLMMSMVVAIIIIHGGWGIRQCGMYNGKQYKNANRYIGQFLLFPIWIMLTIIFWNAALNPLIEWLTPVIYHDGGFWRFTLGLAIGTIIAYIILSFWSFILVPLVFKPAGNYSIYIMTIVLWWALVKIGYNWAYANFNGFTYFLILVFGAISFYLTISVILGLIRESRCPMCHSCFAKQTNLTDQGVSKRVSTNWESMSDGSINPHHSGSEISNARKLVRRITATHNWNTEHTCMNCGYKWNIQHSQEVGQRSQVLERRWDETY